MLLDTRPQYNYCTQLKHLLKEFILINHQLLASPFYHETNKKDFDGI